MKLAEAFDAAVEEVNAINPSLKLDAIKHYLTIDDSIVLQEICELVKCKEFIGRHYDFTP